MLKKPHSHTTLTRQFKSSIGESSNAQLWATPNEQYQTRSKKNWAMPVSSTTVSRGWGYLGAEGECCRQSGKQNSFLSVSVSRSSLVIFRQADKQICQSESPALWRISPGHMSSTHGPVRWRWRCWCGLKICPWVSQCLCVSICKWEDGMVPEGCQHVPTSSGQGDKPARPYWSLQANRGVRDGFYSSNTTSLRLVKGVCACVCMHGWWGVNKFPT